MGKNYRSENFSRVHPKEAKYALREICGRRPQGTEGCPLQAKAMLTQGTGDF